MAKRRYLQLDVFADRPGAGNALGVVVDADACAETGRNALDGAAMQAIAAWTNLSETIFLLPATQPGADYRVRIFTPCQELPFAGHPSVGAAWAVLDQQLATARDHALLQECAAGLLPVRIDGEVVHVRTPRARCVAGSNNHAGALAAASKGLRAGTLAPELWNNGPAWWLLPLADAAAVREAQPDLVAIAALTRATGAVGLAVFGASGAADHALAVRAFCPADNIPEDPVTGSANAAIAAMLHAHKALPDGHRRYIASQGRELGRDGRVEVTLDDHDAVWISGRVQAVIRGSFEW